MIYKYKKCYIDNRIDHRAYTNNNVLVSPHNIYFITFLLSRSTTLISYNGLDICLYCLIKSLQLGKPNGIKIEQKEKKIQCTKVHKLCFLEEKKS